MHFIFSRACRTDIYLFPMVKLGGTCAMLNFEIICFKVAKVEKFLSYLQEISIT